MNISSRNVGSARVVSVGEDVSQETVREFAAFMERLTDEGALSVVLDLAGAAYITSRGLGAIVATFTVLRKRGGNLVLLQPRAEVRSLLELTHLDRILDVAQTESEALSRVAK